MFDPRADLARPPDEPLFNLADNESALHRSVAIETEVILERAKEKFQGAKPRIISDNGPQFIARDFKEFVRIFTA